MPTRDYEKFYRTAIERVFPPLKPSQGTPAKLIQKAEARIGIALPNALRAYLHIAGRWQVNRLMHRILPAGKLGIAGEHLIIAEENQNVVWWGIPLAKCHLNDPPVFQNGGDLENPKHWFEDSPRTSNFLLLVMYFHASCCGGAPHCLEGQISAVRAKEIEANWARIASVMEMRVVATSTAVICLQDTAGRNIGIATKTREELSRLRDDLKMVITDPNQ